ncbi:hypothetical protein HCU64_05110 [Methylobacterium sp. C25]|uniref:hypothetical protein n=1 Tax=Methylobacterium sp. C25 TaxID=2721622 RepID=UPI001F464CA9|nr:hypothetical protein [Methylobacterium sp. C25]MCE4223121.1 hypothetical protein [Methylobacterium sp. C25]
MTIENDTTLPEPVRDHLGQQLRTVYTVGEEKPRFLGDDEVGLPLEFAPQIERLETRLKTHAHGTEAVGQALERIVDAFGVHDTPTRPANGNEPG